MNSDIITSPKHGKLSAKRRGSTSSDSCSSDKEKVNQHKKKKTKLLVQPKKRRNTSKHKYKKGRSRSSSTDSSTSEDSSTSSSSDTSSSSSSSEEEKRRKKKRQKLKKLKDKTDKRKSAPNPEKKSTDEGPSNDIPLEFMEQRKSLAPMTKEEWEKRQSVVRRVYDETTGRHRLIKGDGEVIEEIVSKERHKQINQQATKGDGEYFQSQLKKM